MMRGGWVCIMTNRPDGTLYVGVTSNLERRVGEHKEGLYCAYYWPASAGNKAVDGGAKPCHDVEKMPVPIRNLNQTAVGLTIVPSHATYCPFAASSAATFA
jgi:hypothetical protein